MKLYLYLFAAIAFLIPNFIDTDINDVFPYNGMEKFNPLLDSINSVDKLEAVLDEKAKQGNYKPQSLVYVNELNNIIENRFYHGFSHFSLKENWIAAVGEKVLGYGLASKVHEDDILKHPYAACSQQSMVVMEILRRKGLPYRKAGFPHHFALETKIDNHWYYFDTNMEPEMTDEQRLDENWKRSCDTLKKYYSTTMHKNLGYQFGDSGCMATVGKENEPQAQNARLFQSVTGVASKVVWLVPFFLFYLKSRKKKK